MPGVHIALHLSATYDNDITKPIVIYNENYKFATYLYNILKKFTLDNKIIVTSHSETVKKFYVWRTCSDRILKRSNSITYELNIP